MPYFSFTNWKRRFQAAQARADDLQGHIDYYAHRYRSMSTELIRIRGLYMVSWASDEAKKQALDAGIYRDDLGDPSGARGRYTTKDVARAIRNTQDDQEDTDG